VRSHSVASSADDISVAGRRHHAACPSSWSFVIPTPVRHRPHNSPRSKNNPRFENKQRQGNKQRPEKSQRPDAVRSNPAAALDAALDEAVRTPAPELTSFTELGLPAPLISALKRRSITEPFAIQTRTLPDALAGRDVLGRAQTGSGKTLAFGLPMLTRLDARRMQRTPHTPRALVLVPTRELANQVSDALAPLAHALDLRITTVFGGASMGRQIDQLRRGTDIVVATPGRLIDLMERRAVSLAQVEIGVLDEADHMADMGFLPAVTRILDTTPERRQLMLFSATLDQGVARLVTRYLNEPAVHAVAPAASPVDTMEHRVFLLRAEDKVTVAAEIASRPARTLFFVRTKHGADRLAKQLNGAGAEAVAIHGNLSQNQRLRALDAFTSGRCRVLVATDVAARGLHVDDLDLVVHYDPPNDHKDYLHRSGRTARAGAGGTVISFVDRAQARAVERMHAAATVTAETTAVTAGHPAVREVASSGDAIVVTPLRAHEAAPETSSRRAPQQRRTPRRPRQGQGQVRSGRPRHSRSGARASSA
jgi:superfamily II DNA/RNA helicase